MVFTTAMETMNRFHYCYGDEEWNYNAKYKSYILCFRLILDTYGIIMRNKTYILSFSDYFRHLWNYNENKNHIYCVFRIILDIYGITMIMKIIDIVFFGLF